MNSIREYEGKAETAAAQMREAAREPEWRGLRKTTSNLFRARRSRRRGGIDLRRFNQVLRIDTTGLEAEAEGMITYEHLVEATLRHGLLPPVVPQLKSITLGGAISGGGIESSSFRYGFVHETVQEMEILLSSGERVTCNAENRADLFYGIPNSYGTLGYVLRARIPLMPAGRFVKLTHRRFRDAASAFAAMEELCLRERSRPPGAAFVDGVVFSAEDIRVTVGEFVDEAPWVSDYRFMRIYYRSIREREIDYMRTADYIWRWDTDWFWCARAFGMEWRPLRFLFGACGLLRSTTYWTMRDLAARTGLLARLDRKQPREYVIQDVEIPVRHAEEFLEFLQRDIGIAPIWLCPTMAPKGEASFALYQMDPLLLYINFGFWGSVRSNEEPGHFNRLVERRTLELDGRKSLYSTSIFPEEEFWAVYNGPAYRRLKQSYDAEDRLGSLYEKCVRRK
jgi:FAD/FMN-containing dehydrogenase